MNKLRAVLSFGSKTLPLNEGVISEDQKVAFAKVGEIIAKLSQKYELVVVHGNNYQLEELLTQATASTKSQRRTHSLDLSTAMTQGQTGYLLSQAIDNSLAKMKRHKKVASLITRVVVSRDDPTFRHPSKPIGRLYTAKEAIRFTKLMGWEMRKEEGGRGYRRLVPSPESLDIVEKQSIVSLLDAGTIVIAAGGGGIPVTRTKILKTLKGVEAVVDADLSAERIAELVKADIFVSVTDAPHAYLHYGQPDQIALGFISPAELDAYIEQAQFEENSMLPKVQAAVRFAAKRKTSIITSPDNLEAALARRSGTIVQG